MIASLVAAQELWSIGNWIKTKVEYFIIELYINWYSYIDIENEAQDPFRIWKLSK